MNFPHAPAGSVSTDTRVPVTILTGFLGAGKTTLLNHALQYCAGLRVGIIENELGDIGIDNQLVEGVDEEFLMLTNGCMCCSVRGDLIKILHRWLDTGRQLDRVVIETTGIADPGPIVETFAAEPRLRRHFSLQSVITVVDALHIDQQLREGIEAQRQVAYADWLLLNKVESAAAADLISLEERLGSLNPLATIKRLAQTPGDLAFLFAAHRSDAPFFTRPSPDPSPHGDIQAVSFEMPGSLNGPRFYRWLGDVLGSTRGQLLRAKGILSFSTQERRIVLQGVRDVITFNEGMTWNGKPRRSQLVLIGRRIRVVTDQAELLACGES